MLDRSTIVTMPVDVTNLDDALQRIHKLATADSGSYVCVSNVHMCIEAYDSAEFKEIVSNADLVLPDGKPLSWAQKLLGHSDAKQVRGQDIVNALCELSANTELKIGLYGGSSPEILTTIVSTLQIDYPGISIVYSNSPPFRPLSIEESSEVNREINAASVDILLVGIGCPKQERWMAEHKKDITCVSLGVGAVFDFIAGEKKHAPRWMQNIGMEWLFRLMSEPTRLFSRYFKTNPRFIWLFAKQLVKQRL